MSTSSDVICLVDDEPSVLKAVARLLASEGLHAKEFSEPASFLDYARRHSVRAALVDIRMPVMTGFEVLAELRTISPGTRVILMTGESDPEHQAAALSGGASAFILKPFDSEVLLRAVSDAMAPRA